MVAAFPLFLSSPLPTRFFGAQPCSRRGHIVRILCWNDGSSFVLPIMWQRQSTLRNMIQNSSAFRRLGGTMIAWKPTTAVTSGAASVVNARHRHISSTALKFWQQIEKVAKQYLYGSTKALVNEVSEYVLSHKVHRYKALSPDIEKKQTSILAGLKASTVEVICDEPRVRAIRLGNGATLGGLDFAGDTIYERDFYPQLVRDMRTARLRVLLLGNSGVGKSMFQYYLLARYMNPAHFQDIGSALPTRRILFGSAAPPKVVIRHLPFAFHVLFLEKGVAHLVTSHQVLECFDPATTLYFYEPGETHGVEPVGLTHELPTLATMSPDESRYKEFKKNAEIMYCPVYTGEELLAIGRDMRQLARGFPDELLDLYSDANINKRFDTFNGIFRYVLPKSEKEADRNIAACTGYLERMDPSELIDVNPSTLVQRVAGSFALMFMVNRRVDGEWDFFRHSFEYAGPHVLEKVREAYMRKSFADILREVRRAHAAVATKPGIDIPRLFEEVVARFLTSSEGVCWTLRHGDGRTPLKESQYLEGKLKVLEGSPPAYAEMAVNTLYRPPLPNHAFCDMLYKDRNTGALVCIQVSWNPDRTVRNGPLGTFCHAVGLCADKDGRFTAAEAQNVRDTVQLVFCPRPPSRLCAEANLHFEKGCVLESGAILSMGDGFSSGIDE